MHLSWNCMPKRMPIDRTLLMVLCMYQWPVYDWAFAALLFLSWLVWGAYEIVGLPMDIFENYRSMGETEGLGQ